MTIIFNILFIALSILTIGLFFSGIITTLIGVIDLLRNKGTKKIKKGVIYLVKGILLIFVIAILYAILSAFKLVGLNQINL